MSHTEKRLVCVHCFFCTEMKEKEKNETIFLHYPSNHSLYLNFRLPSHSHHFHSILTFSFFFNLVSYLFHFVLFCWMVLCISAQMTFLHFSAIVWCKKLRVCMCSYIFCFLFFCFIVRARL